VDLQYRDGHGVDVLDRRFGVQRGIIRSADRVTDELECVNAMHYRASANIYDGIVKNRALPKGMLVTVAYLALYCSLALWFGWKNRVWLLLAIGLVAGIACIGAANMRRWSRYLVYALSFGFATIWLWSIYAAARVGFFGPLRWPGIILSLIPGLALLAVAGFCSRMAFRHLGIAGLPDAPAASGC
jgi:hypothetical protein